MQKNPELTEQTKRNLADAFMDIYAEKDIAKISVKEIAERAGYNRSTFYSYYDNVQDVLDFVVDSLFEQAKKVGEYHTESLGANLNSENDIAAQLSPDELFIRFYEENSKALTIMFHKIRTPVFTQRLREWIQPECELLLKSLPESQQIEMEYVLEYHISGLFAVLAKWHKEGKNMPIEEIWNLIARVNNQGTLQILRNVYEKNIKKESKNHSVLYMN